MEVYCFMFMLVMRGRTLVSSGKCCIGVCVGAACATEAQCFV